MRIEGVRASGQIANVPGPTLCIPYLWKPQHLASAVIWRQDEGIIPDLTV
jgi:hypothetical protein